MRDENEFVLAARREKAWPPRWMGHDTNTCGHLDSSASYSKFFSYGFVDIFLVHI